MKENPEYRETKDILEEILHVLKSENTNQPTFNQEEVSAFQLKDFRAAVVRFQKLWFIPLVTVTLGLFISYLTNNKLQDRYRVTALLNIEEADNNFLSNEGALSFGFGTSNLLESRIAILTSHSHNIKVAKKLQWFTSHYETNNLSTREIYQPTSYTVIVDTNHQQLLGYNFFLNLQEDQLLKN